MSNNINIENDKSGASVKFPPPLVFLTFMLTAAGAHHFWPMQLGSLSGFRYIGGVVVILGIFITILARMSFKKAETNIAPWKPTTKIVSTGIFAYSRNPFYVAFCLISIGIGTFFNSIWILFSFIPSALIIYYIAIKKEEAYLEKKFGEEYEHYKNKVRRWF